MAKGKVSITERQQYWLDHVKAAAAFEGTMAEYATRHELKVGVLYEWKRKLRRLGLLPGKAPRPAFVAVNSPPVPSSSCNVVLRNGVRVQFSGDLDAQALGEILSAAHSLS